MNEWIEESIKIANSKDYLTKIEKIYPINMNMDRNISNKVIKEIKEIYVNKDEILIVKKLLEVKKFPIDNPYISCLRNEEVFKKNRKMVKKIGKSILDIKFNDLITLCKQPKSGSRQFGNSFKNWLQTINIDFLEKKEFDLCTNKCFLKGSDSILKNYVNTNFNGNLNKGIDLVFKKNKYNYVLGEAKFISASGGTQTNQLNVALDFSSKKIKKCETVAIVDGVVWFDNSYLNKIKKTNTNIMTALLFEKFIKT